MGLFDGAFGDETDDLVANADGESVTPDRLRNQTGGLFTRPLLSDQPLVDYLRAGEQPHHLLFNRGRGVERNGHQHLDADRRDVRNVLLVTDERMLFVGASSDGDRAEAIPHALLRKVTLQTVGGHHEVAIETPAATYTFVVGRASADARELQSVVSYLRQHVARNRTAVGDAALRNARPQQSVGQTADLWRNSVAERLDTVASLRD